MKLHLGCGRRHIPGFVHVDVQSAAHVDIVGPVERIPFEDGKVSLIYASHVLEHFGRYEYKAVLAEWFRVLAPGGELRLSVPDFEVCARLYASNHFGEVEKIPGLLGLICGGQRDAYDFHKMIFDRASLTHVLIETGFARVAPWDWRRTEHAEVDDFSQAYLPHMDKEHGHHVSLNLSAFRD